jgi:hypothetical protein
MSMTTFSAQVDEDSGLVEQFEEYRQQKGMTKSEAVRSLMRQSLERELEDDQDDVQRDQPAQTPSNTASTSADWIEGNEPIIIGFAFLIGADGILSALTGVVGAAGAALFALTGILITGWILADIWTNLRASDDAQTPDRTHSGAGGAD